MRIDDARFLRLTVSLLSQTFHHLASTPATSLWDFSVDPVSRRLLPQGVNTFQSESPWGTARNASPHGCEMRRGMCLGYLYEFLALGRLGNVP